MDTISKHQQPQMSGLGEIIWPTNTDATVFNVTKFDAHIEVF